MKCCNMRHFIWVFTFCSHFEVTSIQRDKLGGLTKISNDWIFCDVWLGWSGEGLVDLLVKVSVKHFINFWLNILQITISNQAFEAEA